MTPAGAPDLKTIPFVGLEVIRVALNPEVRVDRLEELVRSDIALTQRLLRVANSPRYRRGYEIQTVREAVVHLGLSELRRVALTTSVQDFVGRGLAAEFDRQGFFVHCLAVGALSQEISQAVGFEDPPIAFAAGLLHDVGKAFFDQHYSEPFARALKLARAERLPLVEAERRVFAKALHPTLGDHGAMGSWALRAWKLPAVFAQVALSHHDEPDPSQPFLVRVVASANSIARCLQLGADGSGDTPVWRMPTEDLGIPTEAFVAALRGGLQLAAEISDAAGLEIRTRDAESLFASILFDAESRESDSAADSGPGRA